MRFFFANHKIRLALGHDLPYTLLTDLTNQPGKHMQTFTISGKSGETFTIEKTESMDHLPAMRDNLIKYGKEPVQYWMKRVTEGTRKKAYSIPCWRFVASGNFITTI